MNHRHEFWKNGDVGFTIILAIQIAIIFIVTPLAATASVSAEFIEMLRFGLAVTTILIVTQNLVIRALVAAAFAATLIVTLQWPLGHTAAIISAVKLLATTGFDLIVAVVVGVATFGSGRVTAHRILGGVILYLYVALIFAGVYRLLALVLNPSFSGLPADVRPRLSAMLYFSLGALTTTGSGEIVPVHPVLRSVASLEAVIGQLYPATLLARLVTLHASNSKSEK